MPCSPAIPGCLLCLQQSLVAVLHAWGTCRKSPLGVHWRRPQSVTRLPLTRGTGGRESSWIA
eukprot:7218699-Pyramimonas_sp.AAC.1